MMGVKYCPHPRDVDEEAYVKLTHGLPPAAQGSNACPGRVFSFREFAPDASHLLRSEVSGSGDKPPGSTRTEWCIDGLPFYDEGTKSFRTGRLHADAT